MNELKQLWNQIMLTKVKRTTFGVMTTHVISSSTLFPTFWLIAGSLAKALLVANGIIIEPFATTLYYAIMLGAFYLGIKYSIYYINKKIQVALPKQSGRQSIILFSLIVITTNIAFIYFEDSINFQRIIFSILLVYMFIQMTNKFFNSLEQTDYLECSFLAQIVILTANLSLFLSFLFIYAVIRELNPIVNLIIIPVVFYLALAVESFSKVFVPFFYLPNEQKPIKKALFLLLVTLPLNAGLWTIIIIYFENRYDYF
ncbi:MAG: hypothetical protein PHU40_11855 [Sulfurimonas sp.]|nr:hypothetical protein [Sulfurimonas sp.]